jgi:hypothetical protein
MQPGGLTSMRASMARAVVQKGTKNVRATCAASCAAAATIAPISPGTSWVAAAAAAAAAVAAAVAGRTGASESAKQLARSQHLWGHAAYQHMPPHVPCMCGSREGHGWAVQQALITADQVAMIGTACRARP